MAWHNRTKIVATIGPASNSDAVVGQLIQSGVDVFRINCAHADHDTIAAIVARIRRIARRQSRAIGILADLQGPKIRVGRLRNAEPIYLKRSSKLMIDVTPGVVGEMLGQGTVRIGTGYRGLADDVRPGERILLDDGNLEVRVSKVEGPTIHTRVVYGGMLHQFKGINLPGSSVSAACLSAKDLADLRCVLKQGVDFVALSFVRTAQDVVDLRRHIDKAGSHAQIIAKIERPEAVRNAAK
ncbi:MAG: pyruvate kinase, partial [Planctomycetota bacterium]